MRVSVRRGGPRPVIDDVIREAKVSRTTFYNHFTSLDEVMAAIGEELSNQMTTDILPLYSVLEEPWQRISAGFRLFLLRALLDQTWAAYVTRVDAWPHDTLVARYMALDLRNGKALGQFRYERIDAVSDFLSGATAHCIQAVMEGVDDPNPYMDASVRMAFAGLGCSVGLSEKAVAFSLDYLQAWAAGTTGTHKPKWIEKINTEDGQRFLSYQLSAKS
ncbi:TetR/AcrR family transcriptional regulator [Paraburkholderia terrae]|uniref:TetR/AcrR family transcriptional regulator n=2 Tax=Paraburkholderia terrae TaxID=311230 RepID=A0A2I8EUI9_9BURK|nr:TetR/AcrR family transcriptional regulator [Paraburkholderia terrae]